MEINGQTKLADILAEYPFMKTGMVEINGKFKMLQTPMGKMMANALGAGRMRQASRELIKVYALGCDSGALDDVMELVAWNQGIGTFASEVGPSTFFRAYRTIKEQEAKGKPRSEIVGMLMERFGEQNPDVGVQ